ncbi:excalibur calcium-binding domain-containing protein [Planococcus beigongshangi]|uniref:excalibur calcium-binding domain-containing protein n=1 Tax=Planococcus beigongshangi TaxID=2782536 RepID=UPI00193BB31E|nr:excalibur calcium-binding domain-containing protein [Planococcus beigongshangi]
MEKYIGKRPTSDQKMLASMNKKLLNQAQGIILPSEEKILKVIKAELDKKKAGESTGLLLLTSNSLIFVSAGKNLTKDYSLIFKIEIKEVKEIKEVNKVKEEKVVADKQQLVVRFSQGGMAAFDISKNEDAQELIEVLEIKSADPAQEVLTTVTHDFDYFLHADKLMDLKNKNIKITHFLNKRDDLGFSKNGQRLLKERHKGAGLIIEGYFKEKKKTNDFIVVDKNVFVYEYSDSERKVKLLHQWPIAFFANSIIDHFAIKTEVSTEEGKLVLQGSGKAFEEFLSKEKVTYTKKERKLYQKTIGFRSNKLWKKVAASLIYLSVFFLIIMFSFGDTTSDSESIEAADEASAISTNESQEEAAGAEEQQEQEEAARLAEEKEKEEEAVRLAEEQKKQEEAEAARIAEEQKKQEEAARIAEEQRQQEEVARAAEEQRQQEEAARVAEEQRQQQEAAAAAAVEAQASNVYYKNCDAVRAAGAAPIRVGEPGYSKKLDRDGDGIGCEV